MKEFEKNIKNIFEGAQVPLDSSSWNSFEQKWDNSQMNELIFTQKIVNSLQFSLIPYSPSHWTQVSATLDAIDASSFENSIAEKLGLGSVAGVDMGWDVMDEKIRESELSDFDRGIKSRINNGQVQYDPQHWKTFEKALSSNKNKKGLMYVAAGLVAIALSFLGKGMLDDANTNEVIVSVTNDLMYSENTKSKEATLKVGIVSEKVDKGSVILLAKESTTLNKEEVSQDKRLIRGVSIMDVSEVGGRGGVKQKESLSLKTRDVFHKALAVNFVADETNVGASLPALNVFDSEVQIRYNVKASEVLPMHVTAILPFWDNAAITGFTGNKTLSFFTDIEWKSYYQYGEHIGSKLNQPSLFLLGYEDHLKNKDWSVGVFFKNVKNDHWNRVDFNLTLAYEKSLGSAALRLGGGLKYQRNQLLSNQLQLQEVVINSGTVETSEKEVSDFEVPAEQYVGINVAAMVSHKSYTIAYQANNALLARVNFKSTLSVNHELLLLANASYYDLHASGFLKFQYNGRGTVSPGVGVTYKNDCFATVEYTNMVRTTFTIGKEFKNGIRAFGGFGAVTNKDTEIAIRDVYSLSAHVTAGISYSFK